MSGLPKATKTASWCCRRSRLRHCVAGGRNIVTRAGCFPAHPAPRQYPQAISWIAVPCSAFRLAVTDAGIRKHVSIHSLRHSYATHLVEAGLSLRGVQDQPGHASPTTTARYVRMTEVSKQTQGAVINGLVERLTGAVRASAARAT